MQITKGNRMFGKKLHIFEFQGTIHSKVVKLVKLSKRHDKWKEDSWHVLLRRGTWKAEIPCIHNT